MKKIYDDEKIEIIDGELIAHNITINGEKHDLITLPAKYIIMYYRGYNLPYSYPYIVKAGVLQEKTDEQNNIVYDVLFPEYFEGNRYFWLRHTTKEIYDTLDEAKEEMINEAKYMFEECKKSNSFISLVELTKCLLAAKEQQIIINEFTKDIEVNQENQTSLSLNDKQ